MVKEVETLRESEALSYRKLCRALPVPYSSLMRWKGRIREGTAPVKPPGPPRWLQWPSTNFARR